MSALAREHGVSRSTIRRRLRKGWRPPVRPPAALETRMPRPGHLAAPAATMWPGLGAVLVIIGIWIGALAVFINGQAGARIGGSLLASITFGGTAMAADLLALTLPTAAAGLWHARRPGMAVLAWLTWTLAATLTTMASLGYIELHTSDAAAGRRAIAATSAAVTDQRETGIVAAQLAANAAQRAREAECGVRGPRCRERENDEHTALAALTTAIAVPIPRLATIADADPQVTAVLRLVRWAGLKLATDDVVNLRLVLMAIVPNIAGLVLALGNALRGPRTSVEAAG